ncbi:MAG: HAMP domain-containing protein, partial [Deltaproteobacteria bacterium]|nr:HAMP domain-containing protein [Deltaproteobacteria bacterium]
MDSLRFVKFFRRSIRNKFILVLPLTVIICLGLPFTLSIVSLRQQITEHFIKVGKHHINLLEKQFTDPSKEKLYEEAIFGHDMLYLEIKGSHGEREFLRTLKEGLQYEHRFTKEIFPKTDSITVKKMVVDGESVLEFTKDVGKEKLIVGISLSELNQLLLQQTVTILLISLLATGSLIIVIILMSYFITRPMIQLTQETEAIATGQRKLIPISPQRPLDEVGQLAETVNHLVGQIDNWEETAKKMAAEAAIGKIATQVAHDIRGP